MFIVITKNQKPEKKKNNDKIEDEQGKSYFLCHGRVYFSITDVKSSMLIVSTQSLQPFPAIKAERGRGIVLRKELNKYEFTVSPIK